MASAPAPPTEGSHCRFRPRVRTTASTMGSLAGAPWGRGSLLMLLLRRHPPAAPFSCLGARPAAPRHLPALGAPGPVRGKARGNEYQPSNLKRKHKHGWVARIRTAGGIQVILRRMLKGRKSLTH